MYQIPPLKIYVRLFIFSLFVGLVIGCGPRNAPKEHGSSYWKIIELDREVGYTSFSGSIDGTIVTYAIVLQKTDRELLLIYSGGLSQDCAWEIGELVRVADLENAEFVESYRGYWLDDVRLIPKSQDR